MNTFKEIGISEFSANPFDLIGKDWMLISAGTREKFNAMTASWGALGEMWSVPAAFIFVRPQRFTKTFIDANERFSLSFPTEAFKKQMAYIGKVSGRDEDKIAKSGLTPMFDESTGTPFFAEANTVMICRKLYAQPLAEKFVVVPDAVKKWYPENDYHTLFVGQIEKILVAQR